MKTLLSVDWDYFAPEDPNYDLGHSETEAHPEMIAKVEAFLENYRG